MKKELSINVTKEEAKCLHNIVLEQVNKAVSEWSRTGTEEDGKIVDFLDALLAKINKVCYTKE